MSKKCRVFVGSSAEKIEIADALNSQLHHSMEPVFWGGSTFQPSDYPLESLLDKARTVDFAVFVFAADDRLVLRDMQFTAVRDNVLFELGLFMGSLGRERCYILSPQPEAGEQQRIATDLAGLNILQYNSQRSDGDLDSAVRPAVRAIMRRVKALGAVNRSVHESNGGALEPATGIASVSDPRDVRNLLIDTLESELMFGVYTYKLQTFAESCGCTVEQIRDALPQALKAVVHDTYLVDLATATARIRAMPNPMYSGF